MWWNGRWVLESEVASISLRDEGLDLDLDPSVDPDEDSDNSTVYVQGLSGSMTLDDLADFKCYGVVKVNKRIGQPMICIYLDEETGKLRGYAMAFYKDPPTAKAILDWLDENDLQGSKLQVPLAWKKTRMQSMWAGMTL